MNSHFLSIKLLKQIILPAIIVFMFTPDVFSQFVNTNFLASQSDPSLYFNHNYSVDKNEFKPKYPQAAFILSAGTTLLTVYAGIRKIDEAVTSNQSDKGFTLIALGVIVGPSIGNLYAHNLESVGKGIMTRFAGGLIAGSGFTLAVIDYLLFNEVLYREFKIMEPLFYTLLLSGSALVIYSTIYDFINAPRNVKKYNRAQQKKLSMSPTYYPDYKAAGLSLNLSF